MSDFIGKFTTAMVNGGIIPKSTHDIAPSDRFRRIAQETDRGGKKSISYWLKIERDFAYGYARDFKTGAEIRFNSAIDDPGMTRADLARVKAMMKARQLEEDLRISERHAKIATRSRHKWALASEAGTNPYLDAKGISPVGVRFYGEKATILVPVYEQGTSGNLELVSLQSIYADGSKQFPFGGKKTGCFCPLGQINPTKPLTICEGWATGVSIKDALGDDFNVIVAFDAGNLAPVAKALRRVYKTTPIIIAADNDPAPHHTGQKAAAKAQKATADVTIIMPPDETGDGVDFNDLPPDRIKALFGIEGGGGGSPDFDSQPNQTPAKAPQGNNNLDWASALSLDEKNRLVATSLKNAIMYMLHHRDWQGVFAYDEFRQDVVILKCPPWADQSKFRVESLSDIIITQAAASLEDYGLNITVDKAAKAIDVVASENKFHSAREYLSGLEWDGVIRLETLAQDVMGCTEESPEYLAFVIKKWMTAAVKRVMEPGCKFDHVLILESQKQGLAKSEFLKCLATFNGERYHTDSISLNDLANKDTILKMQGHLIVELAELSGFSRKDDNAIKNWMTQTLDEVRIPFARKTVTYPRQFIFAATTNNYDYLKDPTGNRRYWPVTVDAIIDIEYLETIKSMLWAEAVWYYRDGLYIGPTPEENDLAEKERAKRLQSDAWDEMVLAILDKKSMDEFTTQMVIDEMGLKTTEKNETAIRRINSILRQNGYKNRPAWSNKYQKTVRVWGKGE
jgi:putative DNA primase/helicase